MELKEYHHISYKTAKLLALFADVLPKDSLWSEDFYKFENKKPTTVCCNFNLSISKEDGDLLAPDMAELRDFLNKKYGVFVQYIIAPQDANLFVFDVVDRRNQTFVHGTKTYRDYHKCLDTGLEAALKYIWENRLNKNVNAGLKALNAHLKNCNNK